MVDKFIGVNFDMKIYINNCIVKFKYIYTIKHTITRLYIYIYIYIYINVCVIIYNCIRMLYKYMMYILSHIKIMLYMPYTYKSSTLSLISLFIPSIHVRDVSVNNSDDSLLFIAHVGQYR